MTISSEHQLVKPFGLERSQKGLTKLPLFLFRIFVVTNYFNREQHLPTTFTFASSAVRGGELLETRFNWIKIHVSFVGALRHGKMINGLPWCASFISRLLDRQTWRCVFYAESLPFRMLLSVTCVQCAELWGLRNVPCLSGTDCIPGG